MSYFMTEDQILIQNSVHEFIKKPETQKAIAADNAQHGFPERTWKLLVEMGYVGISIPEEYGGQGHDFTTELILVRYRWPVIPWEWQQSIIGGRKSKRRNFLFR
jgi:acyl-CoA dehydrogenase